ncbi:MAG: knotted carbamoyltransferase YgeW [Pseudomonadota bacterium]
MAHDTIHSLIDTLAGKKAPLYEQDFLLTWDKSRDELDAVLLTAEILEEMWKANISARVFDGGLAVSIFRDQSTRTRFSFASAASLLGLSGMDLDEKKSQIAHGETVRETANMISFLTEVVGIRDDMFIGQGHEYMKEVGDSITEGHRAGVLPQRTTLVNLQCDRDHPTQSMADLLHLQKHFGSLDALKGKKIAMTWAYSPSYGKPLSVPQGIITLMTRFGMKVSLAYPKGYDLMPDLVEKSGQHAKHSGGSFEVVDSMAAAFDGADVVYPKSWAPFEVMKERTELLTTGRGKELDALEKKCLEQNAAFKGWECTDALMKKTQGGKALYMHCLPADITDVSCKAGEVSKDVFERYRLPTYHEAGHKPYVIAAMMLTSRFQDPAAVLKSLVERGRPRRLG